LDTPVTKPFFLQLDGEYVAREMPARNVALGSVTLTERPTTWFSVKSLSAQMPTSGKTEHFYP
jgi:hypothetical protein